MTEKSVKMEKKCPSFDYSTIKMTAVVLCSPEGAATLVKEGRRLVLLIRHGQTDWNAERRLQGREAVPLNEAGRLQSLECGRLLAAAKEAGLVVDKAFCSPLGRAVDTANIITDEAGLPRAVPVEELIERDYGILSGLSTEERRRLYKNGVPPQPAESVADAAARMKSVLVKLAGGKGGAVVAVTHGGVINALFHSITAGNIGTGKNCSENCGVSLVAVGRDATFPLAFGLTGEGFLDYIKDLVNVLK